MGLEHTGHDGGDSEANHVDGKSLVKKMLRVDFNCAIDKKGETEGV